MYYQILFPGQLACLMNKIEEALMTWKSKVSLMQLGIFCRQQEKSFPKSIRVIDAVDDRTERQSVYLTRLDYWIKTTTQVERERENG